MSGVKGPVQRRPSDTHDLRDLGHGLVLGVVQLPGGNKLSRGELGPAPALASTGRAAARPALVRSRMISRSNAAGAATIQASDEAGAGGGDPADLQGPKVPVGAVFGGPGALAYW